MKILGRGLHEWILTVAVLCMAAIPLLVPGFFSHDELQWLARADVADWSHLPWVSWVDWQAAQYRPLTFNLWLIFAWFGGYSAFLAHLPNAVLGLVNALLLMKLGQSYQLTRKRAWWVAALFLAGPYVVYTHAWVGTLADLLVLACVLISMLWIRRCQQAAVRSYHWPDVLVVVALTVLALASKESAVVMPGLLVFAAFRSAKPRRALVSVVTSGLCVVLYLAMRLQVILYGASTVGHYSWSLQNIPLDLTRYLIYPWSPNTFEVRTVLMRTDWRLYLGLLGCAGLLVVLWRAGREWPWLFLGVVVTALLPVLILENPANQYAYLASAAACLTIAIAATDRSRAWRLGLRVLLVLYVWHGLWIANQMIAVGSIQKHLYADLVPYLLRAGDQPLTVRAQRSGDDWILSRLLFRIPSYDGVLIDGHATRVPPDASALLVMRHDGHLVSPEQSMPVRIK